MKNTTRWLAVLIALLLMVSVCPVAIASAAGRQADTFTFDPDLTKASSHQPELSLALNGTATASSFDFTAIHDELLRQFENCATVIPLQAYRIPLDQAQALVNYIGS